MRDIETCLRAHSAKLYHLGIRGGFARSTLADANENRYWRICQDSFLRLIQSVRKLYAEDNFGIVLAQTVNAFDSTTIDLCLAFFPWARFRQHEGAVKLHTLLDLRGNIPTFIQVSDDKLHDVNILDQIAFEAGSFCVIDRGYIDFARLHALHLAQAFSEAPKKCLDPQMPLDPFEKESSCQRQRYSSAIVRAGRSKLLVRKTSNLSFLASQNFTRRS